MFLRVRDILAAMLTKTLGFCGSVRTTVSCVTVAALLSLNSSLFTLIEVSAFWPETDLEFTSTETGSPAFRVFSTVCVFVSPFTVVDVSMCTSVPSPLDVTSLFDDALASPVTTVPPASTEFPPVEAEELVTLLIEPLFEIDISADVKSGMIMMSAMMNI